MERKYKFFIKEVCVIFSQKPSSQRENQGLKLSEKDAGLLKAWLAKFSELLLDQQQEVEVEHLELFVGELFKEMRVITAGGGFVLNKSGELLMIHRRGFWDLPKGKIEKGEEIEECAVREVEEECGVSDLKIDSKPFHTYHLYRERNGDAVIKDSVWFLMRTKYADALVPQTEEDIEEAIWQQLPVPAPIRLAAYSSINQVIDHFQ
jgi:8-oxo-dGTP pyrophosphatase MutT (NUDIX family)